MSNTNKPHHGVINNGVLTWVNEPENGKSNDKRRAVRRLSLIYLKINSSRPKTNL